MIKAEDFIGRTKMAAQNLAEGKNMLFRLLSIDGDPYFSIPEDIRTDRVCIHITNGLVSAATIQ
jgi:hypothetical protein